MGFEFSFDFIWVSLMQNGLFFISKGFTSNGTSKRCRRGEQTDAMGWLKLGPSWTLEDSGEGFWIRLDELPGAFFKNLA